MKILNLSLDQSLLNHESAAARRVCDFGTFVDRYEILVPARFDSHQILSENVSVSALGGLFKFWSAWRLWVRAEEILSDKPVDLITVQDTYVLALIAWRLARKFDLPLEIQVHGFERFRGWRQCLARFLLPKADGVRVVSERLKKQLGADFKVSPSKISVIPITADFKCDLAAPLAAKDPATFVFLSVSRLVAVKNIAGILRALAALSAEFGEARLWIVGDGPERQRLERLAARLDLRERVSFFGQRNDLSSFYRAADAFVLFSFSEGWGLSVIEAGTCGLPVLMSDVGCAGEIVRDQETGLVVPVGDEEALAAAMRRLLLERSLAKTLAEALAKELKTWPSRGESLPAYQAAWEKLIATK